MQSYNKDNGTSVVCAKLGAWVSHTLCILAYMQVCLDVIIKAGCVINIAQGVQLLRVRLKKLDKGGGWGL